ncbi:MAG: hypothetical protein ABI416_16795 [Ginsengibacter sp.]
MPTQVNEIVQNSGDTLFIGLQSYTEAQADIFYGRDEEIDRLTNLIKANTLTIVFGKSGTGKTSLLNAGVFPRLRKDYSLPFRIRLEFNDDSPDLVTQIQNILQSEINKYGFKTETTPSSQTLWEYFHSEPLWKSITPILIFDQFEEIFTLAKKSTRFGNEQQATFWQELADLVENSIPEKLKENFLNNKENINYSYKDQKIKILFSFREEFLPEFESITLKIPSIKYSRFRLMPMNGNQAYEVITKTWKNNINETLANKIVGFFSNDEHANKSYDVMEIEPSLLSQVCSYIDKERNNAGGNQISAEFLDKYPKEIILRSIYDEVLSESNEALNRDENATQGNAKPVNEFLEDKLITDEGYRIKYALHAQDETIRPGIEVLKRKYLLRDEDNSVELTHDVLVPLIKNDREQRRKDIAMATARQRARKRAFQIITGAVVFSIIAAVVIWFLATKKARKDKEVAEKETIQIKHSIDSGNVKLDSIKNQISTYTVNKNDTNQVPALLKRQLKLDSAITTLHEVVQQLTAELTTTKSSSDSLASHSTQVKETLERLIQDSIAAETKYTQLNNTYTTLQNANTQLNANYTTSQSANTQLNSDLNNSKNELTALKNKYDKLNGDYEHLNADFNDYKSKKAQPPPVADVQSPAEDHNLRLSLYSSKNEEIPDNLIIYLIPDIAANKKLIRDSRVYDNHYDFAGLKKAQGSKTAVFDDNAYSFTDVEPGDYFIKICAFYGPYKTITKKSAGNETAPKIDISEILK